MSIIKFSAPVMLGLRQDCVIEDENGNHYPLVQYVDFKFAYDNIPIVELTYVGGIKRKFKLNLEHFNIKLEIHENMEIIENDPN